MGDTNLNVQVGSFDITKNLTVYKSAIVDLLLH